jgi:hypothetical protein
MKWNFHNLKIFLAAKFNLVDWEMVYKTLQEAPKLFQLWACIQVMSIPVTEEWNQSKTRKFSSCTIAHDTCARVAFCTHKWRVETPKRTLDLVEKWLEHADTEPNLLDCIAEYTHGRGGLTMTEICYGLGEECQLMARDQDEIGWRRFMEAIECGTFNRRIIYG